MPKTYGISHSEKKIVSSGCEIFRKKMWCNSFQTLNKLSKYLRCGNVKEWKFLRCGNVEEWIAAQSGKQVWKIYLGCIRNKTVCTSEGCLGNDIWQWLTMTCIVLLHRIRSHVLLRRLLIMHVVLLSFKCMASRESEWMCDNTWCMV